MEKENVSGRVGSQISKGVINGAVIGSILGAITGFMDKAGYLAIPGLHNLFSAIPIERTFTATIIGAFIGGLIGGLTKPRSQEAGTIDVGSGATGVQLSGQVLDETDKVVNLKLREEQLNIYKEWIKTGEVTVRKEIITEEKCVSVPVTREELVIRKKVFDESAKEETDSHNEVIRIPIKGERIEVMKHPVILEDVSIYKNQFEEIQHIKEVLKKEELNVEVSGEVRVVERDVEKE